MKILLVANYLADRQTSMFAFSAMLERELISKGHYVETIRPEKLFLGENDSRRGVGKWIGYIDKFLIFPIRLRFKAKAFDIIHVCDHSNAMYVNHIMSRPNIITCHDVIAIQAAKGQIPGWKVGFTGKVFQSLIQKGLSRAQKIACVSNLTFRDLMKLDIVCKENSLVINNGLNAKFERTPRTESHSVLESAGLKWSDKYFIHVGSDLARKNRFSVLRSFLELVKSENRFGCQDEGKIKLVFVGPALNHEMHVFAEQHDLLNRILTLQNVSHDQLCALYSNALAMIFPSTHEGFGWPVIEAQACGCPVFTSNLAPMNEIGGDAAVYFDPFDPDDMAKKILASNYDEMQTKGLLNANIYSSEAMADLYIEAYKSCIVSFNNA